MALPARPPTTSPAAAGSVAIPTPPTASGTSTTPTVPAIPKLATTTITSAGAGPGNGKPLAPRHTVRPVAGCKWGPVPQGKKKSDVYEYFVADYQESGQGLVKPCEFICVHKDHKGLP